jgi:3D (Asp-Asp-Asp) domain-containing protein
MFMSKIGSVTAHKGIRRSRLRTLVVALALLPAVHILTLDQVGGAQVADSEGFESPTLRFRATAYCDEGLTKSGEPAAVGIVAGDPEVLPLGSVVCIEGSPGGEYDGIYRVMDTGRLVRGWRVDIFIPDLQKAVEFGIRPVRLTVLRSGFPAKL